MLQKLNMPVKVIWGRDDLVIPSDQVLGLPGTVGLHLFPDTGHMPHVEQAMGVNRLIEELYAFEYNLSDTQSQKNLIMILCCGEALIDFVPQKDQSYEN